MSDKRYKRLGNYIELVQERNKGAHITNLMGVSIAKKFIPSIANIIGTDLSTYRKVHPGNFAFCPVTSRNGEKITIARYKGKDDCIISQAYLPFRVIDENELDPDYLMMWVMRSEFDRYARFHSHGSVRELFSWEEMCNVYLPIPSIEEQRKIVAEYQAVEQRIENNNRLIKALEDTAQAIYHHTFVENIDPENLPEGWRWGKIADIAEISSGKTINDKVDNPTEEYVIPVAGATGVIGYASEANYKDKLMTTGRVGTLGVVNRYYNPIWAADNVIVIMSKYFEFTFQILTHLDYNELTKLGVQSLITKTGLENYKIILPSDTAILEFQKNADPIAQHIKLVSQEIDLLRKTKNLLLSKLS